MRLVAVLIVISAARPQFHVTFGSTFGDLPRQGRVVKVPGVAPNGYVCVAEDRGRLRPKNIVSPDDYLSIFDKAYTLPCVTIFRGQDRLEFCYRQQSTYNNQSLGNFDRFELNGSSLYYITSGGAECGNSTYKFRVNIVCDKTRSKTELTLETFIFRNGDRCDIEAVLRSRAGCKIPELSIDRKPVHKVVCIDAAVYDAGIAT
jgi:hypothetical protein